MKFLFSFIFTVLLSYVTTLFLPWWTIALVAFLVAMAIPQKARWSFLSGFLALFILWGLQCFFVDRSNHHILATRIAELITSINSYILIIFLTAMVGGLVGGLSAITGCLLRENGELYLRDKQSNNVSPSSTTEV